MRKTSPDLQDILLGVIEIQPLEGLLRRLADAALHLTGADYAAIGAYGDDRSLTHFETSGASQAEHAAIPHAPLGRGLLGEFAVEPSTINIPAVERHAASAGFPAGHPPMGPFLGVPLKYGSRAIGAFYVTRRPGAPKFSEQDQQELESLAVYAAIAMSNAQVLQSEQRQRHGAEALAMAARGLQEAPDRHGAARSVVTALADALDGVTELALAWVLPTEEDPQSVASTANSDLGPALEEMLEERVRTGRQEITDLLPNSVVTVQTANLDDGGHVIFGARSGRPLRADQQTLLRAAAELVSVGFAALERRQAELALDEYQMRDTVARDLHDDIIQSIYAVGLGLHRAMAHEEITKQEALEKASADLNVVIAELRAYIGQLTGDQPLSAGMLGARLRSLLQGQTTARWEVDIQLGEDDLDSATERHVYLLARELISNVERHAQAETATLTLRCEDDRIRLIVRDDGVGFDVNDVPAARVGVRSIQQRTGDMGGSVIFDSGGGRGTTVTIEVPQAGARSATS